jgi:hypothetical protein
MSLMIVLLGVISFQRLSVREYPKIDTPVVSVRTVYKGASPQVMESQITQPLEDSISGIEGVRTVKSVSREEVSQITVEFVLERNVDSAANDVRDRVARVRALLPDAADDSVVSKIEADAQAILWMRLSSERHPALQLSEYADRYVADRMKTLPGVASVIIGGERRYAMRLWIDRDRLAAYGLTPQDVETALRRQNVEIPSGRIESSQREFTVLTEADLRTTAQFDDMIITESRGYPVRLRDVGQARLGAADERSVLRVNGNPAVGLGVVKQSTANTLSVAQAVKAELARLQGTLPEGMTLAVAFDSSIFIERSIEAVYRTMAEAVILVVLVIFVFLRSFRATLIPFVTIPVSLVGAVFVLYLMGFTINVLTLLGLVLAIGLVVDDAIVVLENCHRHVELGKSPHQASVDGSREIAFAVIAMSLTLTAVFAPVAFVTGNTGRLFAEFALTVASAVAVSGFVALTLTPMMCSRILKAHEKHGGLYLWMERFFHGMNEGYRRALGWLLRVRVIVVVAFFAVLAGAVAVYTTLKDELSPLEDRGFFITLVLAPEGASMDYTDAYMREVERMFSKVPEIRSYFTVVAPGLERPNPVNLGIGFSQLAPWDERQRKTQEITGELGPKMFGTLPGVLAFPINPPSLGQSFRNPPVQFVIQANSYEELETMTNKLLAKGARVEGARQPRRRPASQQAAARGGHRPQQGGCARHRRRDDRAHAGDAARRAPGHAVQARGQAVRRDSPARGEGPGHADRPHLDLRACARRAAGAARQPGQGARDGRPEGAQPLQPPARGAAVGERRARLYARRGARGAGGRSEGNARCDRTHRARRSFARIPRVRHGARVRLPAGARVHLPDARRAIRELRLAVRDHADGAARVARRAARAQAERRHAQRVLQGRHGDADRIDHQARDPDRRVRQPAARARHAEARRGHRSIDAAPAADPDDYGSHGAGRGAARDCDRRRRRGAAADRLGDRRRADGRHDLHAVRHSDRLPVAGTRAPPGGRGRA